MPDDQTNENSMLESPAIEPLEREQRLYERVVEKVMDKLERDYNQQQLRNFVTTSSLENEYSTLQGIVFEQIAH